jgi:ADP-heptose:LPS heptosyltransferase
MLKRIYNRGLQWVTTPEAARSLFGPFVKNKRSASLTDAKSILVIRLDEVGDIVLTSPFLRELRRNAAAAWITLLVKPGTRNLVEHCPYVNEVLAYDRTVPAELKGAQLQWHRHKKAMRLAIKHLWTRHFDVALVPRWDVDYYHGAYLSYFSRAHRRIGFSECVNQRKQAVNRGFDRLFTDVLDLPEPQHEVERNLALLRFAGGQVRDEHLEVWLSNEDEEFAERTLADAGVDSTDILVGIGPAGGSSKLKQWPLERFIDLGRWLVRFGARLVIVGGSGEEELGNEFVRRLGRRVVNQIDATLSLRQMAALLKRCQVYVGNDTGPMHLAAAAGTPVVGLFGSSCSHRFAPWGTDHTVMWSALPCSPCFEQSHTAQCEQCIFDEVECMRAIGLEEVKSAVAAQLARVAQSSKCLNTALEVRLRAN